MAKRICARVRSVFIWKELHNCLVVERVFLLSMILLLTGGCSVFAPRQEWSVDDKTDLVVYLKKDATNAEESEFWHEVVGNPTGPTSFELLPGISGVMASRAVDGHRAIAIEFWSYATQEQREYVMSRILDSPLVYTVLEDVAPSEVETLR